MNKRVARILFFKIRPSQEILKIRDGTPLEAEVILIYKKSPQNKSVWHFSSKLDVPSNVVQKKRVARILFFKIRPSQEILKIRYGTSLEAEEILIYIKKPSKKSVWHFSGNLDVPTNVVQRKRVVHILFFKIMPSQEILKIRDGTPLEMQSQEILKIRDGTPLEAEQFLIYIKKPSKKSVWHFSSNLDVHTNVVQRKRVAHILFFKIRPSPEILKIRDGTPLEKKRVARILFFKISPSQEILKIRDGTPLEAEEILIYKKSPQNKSVWHFSSKLDVPSNVVQKKRLARILFFKIRPSQEILKIRYGTPLEAEEILIYIKKPSKKSVWHFSGNLDVPTNVVQRKRVAHILFFKIRPSQEILKIRDGTPLENKRVARILFFKIRLSQEILKIRDGTPLEAEVILIYKKSPQNKSVWHFSSKLDVPSNVVQNKRVARILFFKIRPSQEILKIRYGTPLEAEEILIYIKKPSKKSVWHFSGNLDVPTNVVQRKRVAHILFFKIRPSQEILKIRDGTPLENKRVARILFFKIRLSQEILKIRDGTPLEAEVILIYKKSPQNKSVWHFSSKLDVPSNVVQNKRVARILFFKIRPSQEILKIRYGTPLEAEEILIYIKKPSKKSVWHFSGNLDVPTNVVQRKRVVHIMFFKIMPSQEILKIRDGTPLEKRVARILFFKIRPSQEILKIRDGTPLEAEQFLIYIKKPSKKSVWHFSSNLDVHTNVVQRKRVAHILFFKIRPSPEILKIRDGTPLEKKRVARILFFKISPSQEILKIRDGTPLEAEEILIYKKSPQNKSVWHFSSKLDVPSNVVQKKRLARILFFKIRPSQEILKIRYGTPLEAEEILIYIKKPSKKSVWHFSGNLDVPTNVVQRKRVAHILFFKIRPSQEILKIRDGTPLEMPSQEILKIRYGTPLEAEEILIYIKKPSKKSVWHFSGNLDVPTNVVQRKRVAHILFFKIRPSQEILKIRDGTPLENKRVARILFFKIRPSQEILKIRYGTPLEAEEILIYIKKPSKKSVWHFSGNLDVPTNVVQRKRVAHILFFKIRPSQEILKIRDGTPLENKRVARILFFKIRLSQEILKIRDGTPLEAEVILIYKKSPQNKSVWHFSSKLDVPSNVVQNKRVARILFFKIRPSQEILKIRYGTPLEAEEILIYIKKPSKKSVWHFSGNLDVPTNVVQRKRVVHIMFFKIMPSQEILKIRDGTPLEKRVARILFFKIRPSQEILKIRDGTPLEAEQFLIYIKKPSKKSVWHFSSNLDVHTNVVQRKRVAHILFFKIRPSPEILKIRDGTPLEKRVARILFFKISPSQEILKIRDGTPLEAEEILIYKKSPQNKSVWHFSSKLDVPSNVVQKKRLARILFFKIRPSQEILKIRYGTPLEAEEILIYIKKPSKKSVWHFSGNLDVPTNVVQRKRVAHILFFKIRPSQEILKIRDGTPLEWPSQEILKIRYGTPLEAEEILIYIKKPSKKSVWHFSGNLDVPTNVVQRKRVAHILFFKIRPSQEILKIRDVARILFFKIRPSQEILKIRYGTPLEAEEILIYIKKPSKKSVWHFSGNLDVPTNVVQRKRVAHILFFKIRPSQEILKIRDGTPLENKRVARILFFKIRPSQEILKIRYGTPLEAEEILIYIKKPSKKSVWHFSGNLDVPTNVVQRKRVVHIMFFKIMPSQEILKIRDGTPLEKRVARILFFKIRPSQEILKIRDGTPLEAEQFLIYIKKPSKKSVWHFSSNLDVHTNVVQRKRVAHILFFKIRPSPEILKIRDGTPLEKKRVARILFFKISPSQEILKIRDGTPLEAEEILIYKKSPQNKSVWHFSSKLDVPSNVVQKKRLARILFFKIRPSQEILKIRYGTPLEAEEILIYIKKPSKKSVWHFSGNLDVPTNVVQRKRVAHILFFKIRPSQEILKIRDGTPLEAEEILIYIKKPSKQIDLAHF
ncbi:hypothetical protein OROGR_005356 [Orobanche gracilis]